MTKSSPFSMVESMRQQLVSFVKNGLSFHQQPCGTIWEGRDAANAYGDGSLRSLSTDRGDPIRVAFRNATPVPLLMCWVAQNGELHHFYRLDPTSETTSSDERVLRLSDHIEHTSGGDAFCLAYITEEMNQLQEARATMTLPNPSSSIVGGYRPIFFRNEMLSTSDNNEDPVQLVVIRHSKTGQPCGATSLRKDTTNCCGFLPPVSFLRGRIKRKIDTFEEDDQDDDENKEDIEKLLQQPKHRKAQLDISSIHDHWTITACSAIVKTDPIDTTNKVYEHTTIAGWQVRLEPNWHGGDTALEAKLRKDIEYMHKVLPEHATNYLKDKCPIWVNKSIQYGPKVCPINGKGCCYHTHKGWLKDHGMSTDKVECVEVHNGAHYKEDCKLWSVGGVMVHEFSHAYHHLMVENGYDNKEIESCYEQAMKEGLYDCIEVKGPQGPTARGYACTNCMEYFAELSTAFLGGVGFHCDDKYNKWYPFNRKQLQEHDPRAYHLLAKLWKVDCN